MKHTPLALALLASFAAPTAFSDIDISPIAISGSLQTALEVVPVTGPTTPTVGNGDQSRLDDQGSYVATTMGHGSCTCATPSPRM